MASVNLPPLQFTKSVAHFQSRTQLIRKEKGINLRIPMIHNPLLTPLKPNIQIRACTKHLPRSRQHDNFHPLINIKHRIHFLEIVHHIQRKSISIFGSIERDDDDGSCCWCAGGVVGEFDMGCWEGLVGGGRSDGRR